MNDQEIRRNARENQFVMFAFFVIVFAIVSLTGQKGDPIWDYFQDFQTMLSGILAGGAAVSTIMHMSNLDAKQEERHRALLALSLKGEFVTLERVINPHLERLEAASSEFSRVHGRSIQTEDNHGETIFNECETIKTQFTAINNLLASSARKDADKFFNGNLTTAFATLDLTVPLVLRAAERVVLFKRKVDLSDQEKCYFRDWFEGHDFDHSGAKYIWDGIRDTLEPLQNTISGLHVIKDKLARMEAEYPEIR
ncbi:hypothetical protein FS800_26595 [Agrobacterium vitis]|uniref:hypothetical protein n=1 Tax=Allorhizobium ampelinum TaxID=3025782 RepID=UPI001F15CE9E|nr:hypothetical protein [Allorhizobium ampelinum]MCF1485659.1 hypothetical protein [Allorhizobium ampelinum]